MEKKYKRKKKISKVKLTRKKKIRRKSFKKSFIRKSYRRKSSKRKKSKKSGLIKGGDGNGKAPGSSPSRDEQIQNLMSPETRTYLSGEGARWMNPHMGYGSFLDSCLLYAIHTLVSSKGGNEKTIVCTGQSYFILLSLFFTNSTLIFVDVNIHLLNSMQILINTLINIHSFDDLFLKMRDQNLRSIRQSADDLKKVIDIFDSDIVVTLFARLKTSFLTNNYILYEASITDRPFIENLKSSFKVDYFNITNLALYFRDLWNTVDELQITYPDLLFIASDQSGSNEYIFQYDNTQPHVFTTEPHLSELLNGPNWKDRAKDFYNKYDFAKYVLINRNFELHVLKNTLSI